jgi:hypothetical protein
MDYRKTRPHISSAELLSLHLSPRYALSLLALVSMKPEVGYLAIVAVIHDEIRVDRGQSWSLRGLHLSVFCDFDVLRQP